MTLRSDRPGTTDVILTLEDQARIRRAMFAVPYAADPRVPLSSTSNGTLDVEEVVGFLEGLAHVLRDAGDRNAGNERALLTLRSDVAAFRRIIGTGE